MELLQKVFPESILEIGIPTFPGESSEIAWPLTQATIILEQVRLTGLAILGGDIYVKESKDLVPTYDNWSTDIERGEKWEVFVRRSQAEAKAYLEKPWHKDNSWFVLVVADKPDAGQLAISHVS